MDWKPKTNSAGRTLLVVALMLVGFVAAIPAALGADTPYNRCNGGVDWNCNEGSDDDPLFCGVYAGNECLVGHKVVQES